MVYGSTDLVNIVALALQQISIGSVNKEMLDTVATAKTRAKNIIIS